MTRLAVDTSALLSILQGEPDAERFEHALFESKAEATITAANLLETMLVIESRNPETGAQDLRSLIHIFAIAVEPVTQDIAEIAFRSWKRFGKARHPAALNYGDCFAYALSKHLDAPLLFKGDDFPQTDVSARWARNTPFIQWTTAGGVELIDHVKIATFALRETIIGTSIDAGFTVARASETVAAILRRISNVSTICVALA